MSGPDFVCIGAQKAGTTWLYDNLRGHPEIWMPPVKEFHFFNILCPHKELLGVETERYPSGITLKKYKPILKNPSLKTARWIYRYYHEHKSIAWYYRLFDDVPPEMISGDITPAYSTLDERGVQFARKVLKEDCRVFMILRNPIERIWSGVKMFHRYTGLDVEALAKERILDHLDEPTHRLRTEYHRSISLWSKYFEGRFKVFLYDDLKDNPEAFVKNVQAYIGVKPVINVKAIAKKSNVDSKKITMPDWLYGELLGRFEKEILAVDNLLPGVRQRWLKEG